VTVLEIPGWFFKYEMRRYENHTCGQADYNSHFFTEKPVWRYNPVAIQQHVQELSLYPHAESLPIRAMK